MGLPFAIVLVVGVVAAVAALAWVLATRRHTSPTSAGERAVTHRGGGMPAPGASSPEPGGRPVPGSQADRARHGKP